MQVCFFSILKYKSAYVAFAVGNIWKRICCLEDFFFANIDLMVIMATAVVHCSKRKKTIVKPTTSTQSFRLQELVPSHLTKITFEQVILEDRQSFAAKLMSAPPTQKWSALLYSHNMIQIHKVVLDIK